VNSNTTPEKLRQHGGSRTRSTAKKAKEAAKAKTRELKGVRTRKENRKSQVKHCGGKSGKAQWKWTRKYRNKKRRKR